MTLLFGKAWILSRFYQYLFVLRELWLAKKYAIFHNVALFPHQISFLTLSMSHVFIKDDNTQKKMKNLTLQTSNGYCYQNGASIGSLSRIGVIAESWRGECNGGLCKGASACSNNMAELKAANRMLEEYQNLWMSQILFWELIQSFFLFLFLNFVIK